MSDFIEVTILVPRKDIELIDARVEKEWNPDSTQMEYSCENVDLDVLSYNNVTTILDWDENKAIKWAIEDYLEEI